MREINRKGNDAKPDSSIGQIVELAQDKQFTLSRETIDASMIAEREIKLQLVSGTLKLISKIDGTLYSLTFA